MDEDLNDVRNTLDRIWEKLNAAAGLAHALGADCNDMRAVGQLTRVAQDLLEKQTPEEW